MTAGYGHRRDRLAPHLVAAVLAATGPQKTIAELVGVSVRSVQRIQAGTHPGVKR